MATAAPKNAGLQRSNARVGLYAALFALAMLGMGYAAVPLYEMFCQVTGFGGTTQRATESDAAAAAAAFAACASVAIWVVPPKPVTRQNRS